MESKRKKIKVSDGSNVVPLKYEELREWEGKIPKKDLVLPFKIASGYFSRGLGLSRSMVMDESGLYEYDLEQDCHIPRNPIEDFDGAGFGDHYVRVPPGGMVPPNAKFMLEMGSFKVSCLKGELDIIIGESDFDGRLNGRRATFTLTAGKCYGMDKGFLDYVWTAPNKSKEPCELIFSPSIDDDSFCKFVNSEHKRHSQKKKYEDSFCNESILSIPNFFKHGDRVAEELSLVKVDDMEVVYPMNVRRFYWLKPTLEQRTIQGLIDTLKSASFMQYLGEMTQLNITKLCQPARVRVLKGNCYQILHDNFMEPEGLDVFICLSVKECSRFKPEWTYVAERNGEVVASIPFDSVNTLHIAYRSGGCARFIRHISTQSDFEAVVLSATYKVEDEPLFDF